MRPTLRLSMEIAPDQGRIAGAGDELQREGLDIRHPLRPERTPAEFTDVPNRSWKLRPA
jgi:hypothetical protein